MSTPTAPQLKDLLEGCVDTASKRDGVFTVRRSFFYTHGMSGDQLGETVTGILARQGWRVHILKTDTIWRPFRGGAPVAQSSHFLVQFTMEKISNG